MWRKMRSFLSDLFEFLQESSRIIPVIILLLSISYLMYLAMYAIPSTIIKGVSQQQVAQKNVSTAMKHSENIEIASPQHSSQDSNPISSKVDAPKSFLQILAMAGIFLVIVIVCITVVLAIVYTVLYALNWIYGVMFGKAKKPQKQLPTLPARVQIPKKKVSLRQYKTITRRRTHIRKR